MRAHCRRTGPSEMPISFVISVASILSVSSIVFFFTYSVNRDAVACEIAHPSPVKDASVIIPFFSFVYIVTLSPQDVFLAVALLLESIFLLFRGL